MSRAGDCYDNAVVERFFGTLKAELVRGCVYPSRLVATAAIADYIENVYKPQRRHSHLQYLSPSNSNSDRKPRRLPLLRASAAPGEDQRRISSEPSASARMREGNLRERKALPT